MVYLVVREMYVNPRTRATRTASKMRILRSNLSRAHVCDPACDCLILIKQSWTGCEKNLVHACVRGCDLF